MILVTRHQLHFVINGYLCSVYNIQWHNTKGDMTPI